jgi:hypothetical protein
MVVAMGGSCASAMVGDKLDLLERLATRKTVDKQHIQDAVAPTEVEMERNAVIDQTTPLLLPIDPRPYGHDRPPTNHHGEIYSASIIERLFDIFFSCQSLNGRSA